MASNPIQTQHGARFRSNEAVDFVIVGSGSAGGILARELSVAGFNVVVFEQGPYLKKQDFKHDEIATFWNQEWMGGTSGEHPQTFRQNESDEAQVQNAPPPLLYARMVGGSSVHFTANFWRLHPIDFKERSVLGPISGTTFADWPITYEELEPYYTKVDWEIGVSGAPGPFDPPRSKPFPLPPLPPKSSGVLLERGAKKLGLHAQPAPMAILSQVHNGRAPCINCGFCMLFGCEVGAKSSTLEAMIPQAEATGRCEIRSESTVVRIELDDAGRARRVLYLDRDGAEFIQDAKAVIVAGNGAETARLLLMSENNRHPNGLANSSGMVGKNLMFNGQPTAYGRFEHPLNEFKGPMVSHIIHDFYDADPGRGFYGGGGIDARFMPGYPIWFALNGLPPDAPTWGAGYKEALGRYFNHTVTFNGHTTSLPVDTNSVSLDTSVRDKWGRPALRVTYKDHPDDIATARFMQDRCKELLDAAGAEEIWMPEYVEQTLGAHLLGTCRMGDDPNQSVVDRYHRTHEIENLFLCDGSSMVTSGRGQPTMTIMALAFRAAEHIAEFARKGDI